MMRTNRLMATLIGVLVCLVPFTVAAEDTVTRLQVSVNQSEVVWEEAVEKVAVANPDVADVAVVSADETLVIGKKAGVTTLHIWGANGLRTYIVEVRETGAEDEVRAMIDCRQVRVKKVDHTIVLEGQVDNQHQRDRAEQIAKAYADKVVNLISVTSPLEVMLEARIVEMNSSDIQNLGIKWGGQTADDKPYPRKYSSGSILIGQTNVNQGSVFKPIEQILFQVDALINQGKGRILSQPNVVTLSGDKASFLVGGQIPVPISSQNGQITVEWKDYGVKLECKPTVDDQQGIHLEVKPEVSTLDYSNIVEINSTIKIPAIKVRRAETSLVLRDGQTFAIGGLLQKDEFRQGYGIPLLKDIPIIGKLFESKQFINGETEVIIFVTPKIISK